MTDLLGGQVQVLFGSTSLTIEQIRAGKLRPLAVTTATRWEGLQTSRRWVILSQATKRVRCSASALRRNASVVAPPPEKNIERVSTKFARFSPT